jgi:hypothetical protein
MDYLDLIFIRTTKPIHRGALKFFNSFPITGLTAVDEPDGATSLNYAKGLLATTGKPT